MAEPEPLPEQEQEEEERRLLAEEVEAQRRSLSQLATRAQTPGDEEEAGEDLAAYYEQEELRYFVGLLVRMRQESQVEFAAVLRSWLGFLEEPGVEPETVRKGVRLLREVANFRLDARESRGIKTDLCENGYTELLCKLILHAQISNEEKSLYMESLVDLLDEGRVIQRNMLQFLRADEQQVFLRQLHLILETNFQDLQTYEKSLRENETALRNELRVVIQRKARNARCALEILKFSCWDSFYEMQNYLRENRAANFLQLGVRLLHEYSKFVNPGNLELGCALVELLVELVKGPNCRLQSELVDSRLLETIEDILLKVVGDKSDDLADGAHPLQNLHLEDLRLARLTKRLFLLVINLYDGNPDRELRGTISQFLSLAYLLKRLQSVFFSFVITEPGVYFQRIREAAGAKGPADQVRREYGPLVEELVEEARLIWIIICDFRASLTSYDALYRQTKRHLLGKYNLQHGLQLGIFQKTLQYFKNSTCRVEILNRQNEIQLVYFPRPGKRIRLDEIKTQPHLLWVP